MLIHGNTGGSPEATDTPLSKYNIERQYRELIDALGDTRIGAHLNGHRVRGCIRVLESTADRPIVCGGKTLGIGCYQVTRDSMSVWICGDGDSMVEIGSFSLQKLLREQRVLGNDFRRHVNEELDRMTKTAVPDLLKKHLSHLEGFQQELRQLRSKVAILNALIDLPERAADAA